MHNQYLIKAPSYTQCPNVLFDYWLPILGNGELRVFMVIIRKIIGWHKENLRDYICNKQLIKATGLSLSNVQIAVKSLIKRGLISKQVIGAKGSQQIYYDLVVYQEKENSNIYPLPVTGPPPLPVTGTTKETINKRKQQQSSFVRSSQAQEQEKPREEVLGQIEELGSLLASYKLTPAKIKALAKLPIETVSQAVQAIDQYAKSNDVGNRQALLMKAIKEKWKPNDQKAPRASEVKAWRSENLLEAQGYDEISDIIDDFIVFKGKKRHSVSLLIEPKMFKFKLDEIVQH